MQKIINFFNHLVSFFVFLTIVFLLLFMAFKFEIAIIAPTIEIIFSPNKYTDSTLLVFTLFSLGNLFLYLFFYEKFKIIDADYKSKKKRLF